MLLIFQGYNGFYFRTEPVFQKLQGDKSLLAIFNAYSINFYLKNYGKFTLKK